MHARHSHTPPRALSTHTPVRALGRVRLTVARLCCGLVVLACGMRVDVASGKVLEEIAASDKCNVGGLQIDEDSKEVQVVAFNYARLERQFFQSAPNRIRTRSTSFIAIAPAERHSVTAWE